LRCLPEEKQTRNEAVMLHSGGVHDDMICGLCFVHYRIWDTSKIIRSRVSEKMFRINLNQEMEKSSELSQKKTKKRTLLLTGGSVRMDQVFF